MKRSGQILSRAPKFALPSPKATAAIAVAAASPQPQPQQEQPQKRSKQQRPRVTTARFGEREMATTSTRGPHPFRTVVLTTALGVAVGYAYLSLTPREYTAASKLFVGHADATTRPTADALVSAQADVMRSSEVLRVAEATDKLGATSTLHDFRDPVPALRRGLQIDVAPDGGVITVAFAARQPDEAVRIVNAVVGAYKRFVGDRRLDRTAQLTSAVESIRKPLAAQLADAQRALAALSTKSTSGENLDAARQRVRTFADTLTQAQLATTETRRVYDVAVAEAGPQLAKLSDDQLDRAVQSTDGQAVQPVERVAQDLDAATRRLADLKRTYAENHPSVVRAREDVDRLRIDRVVSTRQAWQASAAHVAELQRSADRSQADVTTLAQTDAERGRLQNEIDRLQTRLAETNRQLDQAVLGGAYATLDVEVLTPAEADDPTRPPTPRPVPTLLLAGLAGLVFGGLLAIAGEQRRAGTLRHVTTIRPGRATSDATLAREAFGLRVLGSLPDVPANADDPADATLKSATSGELATSAAKIPAEMATEGWSGGSLAVASATGGQGRSVVAFALAASLAKSGAATLLIEADPRAARAGDAAGFAESLASGELNGRPQASSVPDLMVLRIGEPHEDFNALLNSPRLSELIEAARATFAHVVFDCPPLDAGDDARLIAATVDSAVIISDGNVMSLRRAATARDVLRLAGATVLGVVLNRTSEKVREQANGEAETLRSR